jgi:hypothetical protein
MDIKGFLDRFEACTVNGVRFVNQNDVEFLIDQLQLQNKPKGEIVEAEVMTPASATFLQIRYKLPRDTKYQYGDKVKIMILDEE